MGKIKCPACLRDVAAESTSVGLTKFLCNVHKADLDRYLQGVVGTPPAHSKVSETQLTLHEILEDLRQDALSIAEHYDDSVYQHANYPTQYARSNMNGVFGEAEKRIQQALTSVKSEMNSPSSRKVSSSDGKSVACEDCGWGYEEPGFTDLVLPNDIWAKVAPTNAILCPNCICKRLDKAEVIVTRLSAHFRNADILVKSTTEQDYQERDGVKYLIGPYTFEHRQAYLEIQMKLYLHRHPKATRARAKRVAMNKWRLVVNKSVEATEVSNDTE